MKMFLMCLVIPLSLFSSEVRDIEFYYLIDREIKSCDEAIDLLNDPFDAYTYYWLLGVKEGLHNAKYIFEECAMHRSGCDE